MGNYPAFDKIPRLNRTAVISEKIDGTNGLVAIFRDENVPVEMASTPLAIASLDGLSLYAGSRTRWITPEKDNFGFAKWVQDNAGELVRLGEGLHFGEWYGKGIQRGYGLNEKRFMLFNTDRWADPAVRPECCEVATVLATVDYHLNDAVDAVLFELRHNGSLHVPGFDRPEGVVIYHTAARQYFKVLLEGDEIPKGLAA